MIRSPSSKSVWSNMDWNFLAVWIGMKTCNARFGVHQLAVAPKTFALDSCHNVCHAQMCPALLLVRTMSSSARARPLETPTHSHTLASIPQSWNQALLASPSPRCVVFTRQQLPLPSHSQVSPPTSTHPCQQQPSTSMCTSLTATTTTTTLATCEC